MQFSNKINLLIIPLALFLSFASYSQIDISGTIVDESNGEPIAYAKVGLINKQIGTVSSSNGKFKLRIPDNNDSLLLRISVYGFKKQTWTITNFIALHGRKDIKVALNPIYLEQEEVTVVAPKLKNKRIGYGHRPTMATFWWNNDDLGGEIAILAKIKRKSYLSDFNLFITKNAFDSLALRLNFYACDSLNNPLDSLVAKSVVFTVPSEHTGNLVIPLKEEHITLSENTILSIELVDGVLKDSTYDRGFIVLRSQVNASGCFLRSASQSEWEKQPMVLPSFYLNTRQVANAR